MNACIVPQDDHFLPEVPPRKNRPPRILESTVTPSRIQTIGNGAGCTLTFSLRVEDPDIDDTIIVRWYVDYATSSRTNPPHVWEDVLESSGRPQRNASAEYTFDVGKPDDPLHPPGDHLVEAVVSDGPLVGHDKALPHPSAPDAGPNLSYIVTYGWAIHVEDGLSCATP